MKDPYNIEAEQSVIGALLRHNDAFDRIPKLEAEHFYRADHRVIFAAMKDDFARNRPFDVFTVSERVGDQVVDCLSYLHKMHQTMPSSATVVRHADSVMEKAVKRALAALGQELMDLSQSHMESGACVDLAASKLESLAEQRTIYEPKLVSEMVTNYLDLLQRRMDRDEAVMPIPTGFEHVDDQLDGGLERGTLTVVGGRPGTGKTAAGLGVARNVARAGVAYFQSMEMADDQVSERNVAAVGRLPLRWLKKPTDNPADTERWSGVTAGVAGLAEMRLYVDEQPGCTLIELRAKARKIKRKNGGKLDLIVVDQLSFMQGAKSDKLHEAMGEYTRGLIAIAKELDCAVILLIQLNRDCEKRPDKRPIMSDIGVSGYIEQDAANIIFLYRDELWHPDTTPDKGICEWIFAKQRQGAPGTVGLGYIGEQTRFETLSYRWSKTAAAPERRTGERRKGF